MELTAAQAAVVEHRGGALCVTGGFGSGKTTALVERWRGLAGEHGPARVGLVVRSAAAVADARARMARAAAAGGRGPLVVTTFLGLALDVLRRHGPLGDGLRLVAGEEQRAIVRDLLAADAASPALLRERWPTLHALVERRAFAPHVASTVLAYQASFLGAEELRTHAAAAGVGDRWEELAAFTDRYLAALKATGAVDTAGAIVDASILLRDASVAQATRERFAELLVDDFETATFATNRLLNALVGPGSPVAVTIAGHPGGPVGRGFGASARHLARFAAGHDATEITLTGLVPSHPDRLVVCRHPSMEADAVVGELVAAHEDGAGWHEMAVVVRRRGSDLAAAVIRALTRRAIPVAAPPVDVAGEPIVAGVAARLFDAAGSEPPPRALDDAIAATAADLVVEPDGFVDAGVDRALDALVALGAAGHSWLDAHTEATAGALAAALVDHAQRWLWRVAAVDVGGVAVVSVDDAAGRQWPVVVLAGCVEGEFPHVDASVGLFDHALLAGPDTPLPGARREHALAEERRVFALASSRAIRTGTCVAAPQPGVLVSRYVEDLPVADPRYGWEASVGRPARAATITATPIHPDGHLQLSASQLDTYEDCPRRWFYDSVLKLGDRSSVWADFGTLVHAILEDFLAPGAAHEHTLEHLQEVGDRHWTDAVARWAPQREQARRELTDILETWWTVEGALLDRASIVAVEHSFSVEVGDHAVRGRIDRVDRLGGEGEGGGIAVVDYKTGRRTPREQDMPDDVQLATYYLAAVRDPELAAAGAPERLELLYLREGKRFRQPVTADHEARAEERILAAAAEMLAEHIEPSPAAECRYCDYQRLCPLQRAGREIGAP